MGRLTYSQLRRVLAALAGAAALSFNMLDSASAQIYTGPIAASTGGAGRAAADPSESSYLNPASLAHVTKYYFDVNYLQADHPVEGQQTQFGALMADGSPDKFAPGSLSFLHRKNEVGGFNSSDQDIQFALAGFVWDGIAIGGSGHHLIHKEKPGPKYTQTNMNLGVLFTPFRFLGLGFVAYDILSGKESVPVGVRTVPTFALGSHVIYKELLRFRLDVVRPDKYNPGRRADVMAGLETYFRSDFAFRTGWQWRETENQHLFTTGLGFKGPRLSFNYTFQKDIRVAGGTRHLFDLWLPF